MENARDLSLPVSVIYLIEESTIKGKSENKEFNDNATRVATVEQRVGSHPH